MSTKPRERSVRARLASLSPRDVLVVGGPILLLLGAAVWVSTKSVQLAPPGSIRMISGPDGSGYRASAEKYKKIIEHHGVKVEILPSRGALDNLQKLADPTQKIDVGFVQGGLTDGVDVSRLVSL